MIKINLLPPEERGKGVEKEVSGGFKIDLRVVIPSALLIITILVVVFWYLSLQNRKTELDSNISQVKIDLEKVKREEKLVRELDENKAKLRQHLGVIDELDKGRYYWVMILDELNNSLPDLTWIEKLNDESTPNTPKISIIGISFSNQKIAEFMQNIAATNIVKDTESIRLMSTKKEKNRIGNRSIDVVSFSLKVDLIPPSQLEENM